MKLPSNHSNFTPSNTRCTRASSAGCTLLKDPVEVLRPHIFCLQSAITSIHEGILSHVRDRCPSNRDYYRIALRGVFRLESSTVHRRGGLMIRSPPLLYSYTASNNNNDRQIRRRRFNTPWRVSCTDVRILNTNYSRLDVVAEGRLKIRLKTMCRYGVSTEEPQRL